MPINPPPGQTSERGGWSVPAEGAAWGLSSRPTMQSSYEDDADTEQASALGSRQLDWDEDPAVVVEEDPSQSSGAPLPNPGMDRAPAQPLRLIVEGTYATQTFPPGRLPLVGPWVISNSLRAWPATDCFANLQVRSERNQSDERGRHEHFQGGISIYLLKDDILSRGTWVSLLSTFFPFNLTLPSLSPIVEYPQGSPACPEV